MVTSIGKHHADIEDFQCDDEKDFVHVLLVRELRSRTNTYTLEEKLLENLFLKPYIAVTRSSKST